MDAMFILTDTNGVKSLNITNKDSTTTTMPVIRALNHSKNALKRRKLD